MPCRPREALPADATDRSVLVLSAGKPGRSLHPVCPSPCSQAGSESMVPIGACFSGSSARRPWHAAASRRGRCREAAFQRGDGSTQHHAHCSWQASTWCCHSAPAVPASPACSLNPSFLTAAVCAPSGMHKLNACKHLGRQSDMDQWVVGRVEGGMRCSAMDCIGTGNYPESPRA